MSKLRYSVLSGGTKRMVSDDCCNWSPVRWSKYFQNQQYIQINQDTFNLYTTGTSSPVLLLIHGGGYSSLTWALFAEEITRKVECQVVAVDLRGHGNTKTCNDDNLALNVLTEDIKNVVNELFKRNPPPIVIIGHSLGGAVAVAAAAGIASVVGICVIDVVEGSALESLSSMQSILRGRPAGFNSIEHAIQWSLKGGQTHNLEAARVSIPGQIKSLLTGNLAASDEEITVHNESISLDKKSYIMKSTYQNFPILEEQDDDVFANISLTCDRMKDDPKCLLTKKPSLPSTVVKSSFRVPAEQNMYTWRIDLSKTEPFWTGWFEGLSQKFLNLPLPKVLLLANIHGLDTTLTVGQMQGKFQFHVLPKSGHAIQEDEPQSVSDLLAGFLVKQKLAVAKNGFNPIMPAC